MTAAAESDLQKLRTAIAGLEAQRALLGEEIVEPAIASLREKISALESHLAGETGGLGAGKEERRIVTVLFADVVGSTTLAEKLDPEEWRELIRAVHGAAGGQILAQHGHILQYLGDGILAVFGSQRPNERDPEHAIQAALHVQAAIQNLATAQPVQMRIGIHTGLVLIGDLELPARRELTAYGDAMNTAARLQNLAPPGGILISGDTYRYTRGLFEFVPQPPAQLKGKREPVQTYLVLRAFPSRFRMLNRGVIGVESELVGRAAELDHIRQAFERSYQHREPTWVQISGPAGIGKSRLVLEFFKDLENLGEQVRVIKARAQQGDEHRAYAFLRRLYFDQFKIADSLPLPAAEQRFVEGVKRSLTSENPVFSLAEDEIEEAAHALGLLTGLAFTDSPYLQGKRHDPAQVKGRAHVLNLQILAALRANKPVVVLLDDLQWVDSASWEFFNHIFTYDKFAGVVSAGGRPRELQGLFVLATARPDWRPPEALTRQNNFQVIQLEALQRAAATRLTEHLLSQMAGVPTRVLEEIVDRSEGVPYYIEEFVNWLIDRGVIDSQAQPWRFNPERWERLALPDTLQHLLLTRLRLAPEAEQQVIQRGSIFGRVFWENGVAALGARNIHDMLVQGQTRGMLLPERTSTLPGENEWKFYHNLLQEAAYTSVLLRERKQLHKAAAEWLEGVAKQNGRLDELGSVLAKHYDQAGLSAAAARWYLAAGQAAKHRAAFIEGRRYLNRALELVEAHDRRLRSEILLERNEILGILGESTARLADDNALIELAQELEDDRLLATAYQRLGFSKTKTYDQRGAVEAFEAALAAARRSGDVENEAVTLSLIGLNKARLGEKEAASAASEQALALVGAIKQPTSQAKIITNASACFAETGDLTRALQLTLQQVEITRRIANISGEALGQLNLGYYYLQFGLFQEGYAALQQAMECAERIGARQISAQARLNLGLANWRLGSSQAARQTLEALLPETEALGDMFGNAVCHTYLGLACEQTSEFSLAENHYEIAIQALRRLGMPGYLQDALAGAVRAGLAQGKLAQTEIRNRDLWEYLVEQKAQGVEFPYLAYLTCARACKALDRATDHKLIIIQAHQALQQAAQQLGEAQLRAAFLTQVPEHAEIEHIFQQIREKDASEMEVKLHE